MNNIIFEYTPCNINNQEGYTVWMQYPDSEQVDEVGFFNFDELERNIKYYQDSGDHVLIRRKR